MYKKSLFHANLRRRTDDDDDDDISIPVFVSIYV